jgi:hypothetical protein
MPSPQPPTNQIALSPQKLASINRPSVAFASELMRLHQLPSASARTLFATFAAIFNLRKIRRLKSAAAETGKMRSVPIQTYTQDDVNDLEERMTQFALGRFRAVFDLGKQRRFDPYSPVRDLLAVRAEFCGSAASAAPAGPWQRHST